MQFGCFVQLEGVRGRFEGLVHISQLRRDGRIKDVNDVVKRGDKVKVKVLSITGSKLSLSMKVSNHLSCTCRVLPRNDYEQIQQCTDNNYYGIMHLCPCSFQEVL